MVVDASALETFKVGLDRALMEVKLPLLTGKGWTRLSLKVPSRPKLRLQCSSFIYLACNFPCKFFLWCFYMEKLSGKYISASVFLAKHKEAKAPHLLQWKSQGKARFVSMLRFWPYLQGTGLKTKN